MKADISSRPLSRADAPKNTPTVAAFRHRHHALTATLALAILTFVQPSLHAATASVNLGSSVQTVRGFGGAVIWEPVLSDADCDKLFGSGAGTIGFTIERVRVAPDTGSWANDRGNAQKAKARGAIVFATPWSPPASMKSNNNIVGGSLNTSQYGAFANYLNNFVSDLAANNASLYAISVQNEPDFSPDYESCTYTTTQMFNFIKNNAGVINTKVIAAETVQFNKAYTDGALNNATARANLDIVGTHLYGGGITDYPLARNNGKEVWMTEHLNLDTSMTGQMQVAKEILDCFAVANFNAYVWWQLKRDYGPIDPSGNRTKRGCVFAQFARIVRPGWVRVNATYNPSSGVFVAAFKSGSKMAVVAVNNSTSSVSQTFSITGGTIPSSLNCWRTSSSQDLATLAAVGVSGGAFTNSLPGQSITTFYTP